MKGIDLLEHGGGDFHLRRGGELINLPDPRSRHYQWVLMALSLEYVPGTPQDVTDWQRKLIFDRWTAAWDLPEFASSRRLAYLVDHYRPAISHDLTVHAHQDLGQLWRARRWTLMLDIIDRLPSHSQYAASVSMDEEHAKMLAESLAERQESGDEPETNGPSLTTWTPEVAMLAKVVDATRGVQHAIIAVNGNKVEAPTPEQRPKTPLEKALRQAEFDRKKASHESLVARVLRKKSP